MQAWISVRFGEDGKTGCNVVVLCWKVLTRVVYVICIANHSARRLLASVAGGFVGVNGVYRGGDCQNRCRKISA